MNYFSAQNLRRNFDSFSLEASFECAENTMTAIVGPSGSGKSTILRIICGLEKSDSDAKIFLGGTEISGMAPSKRQIGMVFQSHSLFEHLKVEDNVAYGLVSQGIKKNEARERAKEFLKNFGLEGFEKRLPATLSGGEAQRVCLARTLIMKPRLVLFDEPLSALDAPLRKKMGELICSLQDEFKFTGIMVTHDIEEAKNISDRIITLKKGKICWNGNPADFDEKQLL